MMNLNYIICLLVGFLAVQQLNQISASETDETSERFSDDEMGNRRSHFSVIKLFTGPYYERTYQKINNHLVDAVHTTDVGPNMKEAISWLDAEIQKGVNILKRGLVEALEQFTSLDLLSKGDKLCNRVGHNILLKNHKATKGRARISFPQPFKRIDLLVWKYSIEHAINCRDVYIDNFNKIFPTLEAAQMKSLGNFIDQLLRLRLHKTDYLYRYYVLFFYPGDKGSDTSVNPVDIVQMSKSVRAKESTSIAYNVIKISSADDPDHKYLKEVIDEKAGKLVIREDKIRELFQRYIIKPCQYYISKLGPDVFKPALYDVKMLDPEYRYTVEDGTYDFHLGWIRFRLCDALVNKEQKAFANDVISLARKEAKVDLQLGEQ